MPGIIEIYTGFVDSFVQQHQRKGEAEKISRAELELLVLSQVDTAEIPIKTKLSWYHAVLASSAFDAHWMSVRERHSLPESCTARYVPDQTLLDYEEPVEDEVEEEPEDLEEREADDGVEDEMVVEVADDDESDAVETAVTTAEVISATTVPSTAPPTTVDGSRESSPDSSDISESSSSGDESERGWQLPPLALVPVKRKVAYCDRCQSKGHSTNTCRVSFEPWTVDDWESVATDDLPNGLEDKQENRRMFLTGFLAGPRSGQEELSRVVGWLEGVEITREAFYTIIEAHQKGDDVVEGPSARRQNRSDGNEISVDNPVEGLSDISEEDDGEYTEPPSEIKGKGKERLYPVNHPSQPTSYDMGEDSRAALGDVNGLAREEGDDGEYEPSRSAAAKKTPSVKSAGMPKGVAKKKAAPRKKQQTPAQLLTAAAKTRQQAQPQVKQELSTLIPETSASAQASEVVDSQRAQSGEKKVLSRGPGTKRTLDLSDEDDEPLASKRAKTGGAASANGGRKMATPKKNGRG